MSAISKRRAALREILRADPEVCLEAVPANLRDMLVYVAGEAMPGYMPDSAPCGFATEREARGYARSLGGGGYAAFVDCVPLSDWLA